MIFHKKQLMILDNGISLTPNYDFKYFIYYSDISFDALRKVKELEKIKLKTTPHLNITYGYDDPVILEFYNKTIFRFNSSDDKDMLIKLNNLFRKSTGFYNFYKEVEKITTVLDRNWLETEYNTAVLLGLEISTFYRLKKQMHIFPYWIYKTLSDSEVRKSHSSLENIILPANDKRWINLYPVADWNCRCYIVPRLKNEVSDEKLKESSQKVDVFLKTNYNKNKIIELLEYSLNPTI